MNLLFAVALLAQAQAPSFLPLEAYLESTEGVPLDGPIEVTLRLYDADRAVFTETQAITARAGQLILELGNAGTTLDLGLFAGRELTLGVQIGDDAEMSPRISLGFVPYAICAQHADDAATLEGSPPASFRRASDPYAWSALEDVPADVAGGDAVTTWTAGPGLLISATGTVSLDEPTIAGWVANTALDNQAELRALLDDDYAPASDGHAIDPRAEVALDPGHAHALAVEALTSTRTAEAMPYVQRLVCRKN